MNRKGFTLFEVIAVLTVISIGLMVLVGAYGSWDTVHALTGATRVLEAGLIQARTLAITSGSYVGFDYGSVEANNIKTVTGFQVYLCTPTNDTASVEDFLQKALSPTADMEDIADDKVAITQAAPFQRLSGHVRLTYIPETDIQSVAPTPYSNMSLFFRPDGSVLSDPDDKRAHYICVYSQEHFSRGDENDSEPLRRYLRIDLATGLITVISPNDEVTP